MLKIVADDKIPFLKGILEPFAEVRYFDGKDIGGKNISGADALIIRTRTKCTRELLDGSAIKYIGTATIGFDHIDTAYCESHGIKWKNAPGCNSSSVRQYIAAALLKIASDFRFDPGEKTIGIIGAGNVGSKVAEIAGIFGMKVLLNDPPRERTEGPDKFTDLGSLLKESDIVTLHVPLNFVGADKTYHLLDHRSVKKLKKRAWLINTSRGEVIETDALVTALDSVRLSGAVIDVWENEPDIDAGLMQKSFIATPHIAGYSTDGKANGTAIIVNDLASFFGIPLRNWYPLHIPAPAVPVIEINASGKGPVEVMKEAVGATYDIGQDDISLRFAPSDFEKLRGNYPLRREFQAYTVKLTGAHGEIRNSLAMLGFNVQRDP